MALTAPETAGDQLNPADIENHTLIVIPTRWHAHVATKHTKPGEESPCIEANVVDFSDPSGQPVVYRGVLWFNVMLVNGLKRQIGQSVLGRMTKGTANQGKNPPWQLLDLLSNPAEKAWVDYASGWLEGPDGVAFEQEGANAVATAANQAQIAQVSNAAPASPPAGPPAPPAGPPVPAGPPAVAGPPAPPAGPPVNAGPPAAPSAPPAPAAPAAAAPAGDLAAQLAGLPAEEVQKMLSALANQSQAAH